MNISKKYTKINTTVKYLSGDYILVLFLLCIILSKIILHFFKST